MRALLEVDFCPNANRYVYWLKHPLALLLLAAVGGAMVGSTIAVQGWLITAATVTISLIGLVWPWLGMRGLTAELVIDHQRCREGDVVPLDLVIHNHWPWPVWGLKLVGGFELVSHDDPDFALASVPALSRGVYRWEFKPQLRGEYPREALRLATSFPFGLYEASRPVHVERRLLVRPGTCTVVPGSSPRGKRWSVVTQDTFVAGRDGDVLGTRAFRQGDSLRDIHWPLSARHGNWVVRERQSQRTAPVRVVVDTDPRRHSGQGADSTLAWSLRVGATLAESFYEFQHPVELWLGQERFTVGAGWEWWDQLSRWQPSTSTTDLTDMASRLGEHDFFVTTSAQTPDGDFRTAARIITLRPPALCSSVDRSALHDHLPREGKSPQSRLSTKGSGSEVTAACWLELPLTSGDMDLTWQSFNELWERSQRDDQRSVA
jgi:uncharacterized protein (DUF58 family)